MDDDVAKLVAQERIAEAAALACDRGDVRAACDLYERACDWERAARCALVACDPARAMRLAVLARDDELTERVLAALGSDPPGAERAATWIEARGEPAWAARIFEAIGKKAEASRAWERAGNSVRAAELLEALHDVVGAARLLEAATRREPSRWPNFLALGHLLLRYGKTQAAARALQAIPADASERDDALPLLVQALEQLGLDQAAAVARRDLACKVAHPAAPAIAPPRGESARALIYGGRYEVVREIASTAGSRVLECIDTVRGEPVAIKVYTGYGVRGAGRDVLARFERELHVLASIDHPNVVPMLDYFSDGPALVLAFMPGGTLEQMLERGPIAPARAAEIAGAVLGALAEAHRVGVLHRDIKPSNVLFDAAGTARLADFGAAHLGDLSATATAGVIGTFSYMSPEQRNGEPATVASDLYGVGALLFEMLTGERLRAGTSPRLDPLPSCAHRELDPRHDALVASLTAPSPAERPTDAGAARRALTALPWPAWPDTRAAHPKNAKDAPTAGASPGCPPSPDCRVQAGASGAPDRDTWLDRPIQRIPLEPPTLERAAAFARAVHPMLQTVLRVDRKAHEIWLDRPDSRPLDRPLSAKERAELRGALQALHGAGMIHGSIDPAHIHIGKTGNVIVRFSAHCARLATIDDDHRALSRL
ncbi:protein kinase domain-containing protein [Pendulispora albinea]|uniref:Protein kinase n=1 Tax=Pendulispora albinea TaxID=2741071 RepID=A0ABZ2M8I9_9BACT